MATQEQVDQLMQLFAENRPQQAADWQQRQRSATGSDGMLGVLLYLSRAEGAVTAGMISKVMRITTGRVSVLIKKMVEKGLVTRTKSAQDARVTEIRLTDKGRGVIDDIQRQRNDQLKQLIDTVGMERLEEYVHIQKEVFTILTPPSVDL